MQNLLALRFANSLFEPLWNTRRTSTTCRSRSPRRSGVEGRGGYYDERGALRDMVQNHMLQLLCLVAHGAAGLAGRRRGARREAQGAARAAADRRRTTSDARPCAASTAPARSTAGRCPATPTSSASASSRTETFVGAQGRDRQLALGRRAVLPAHRQAPAGAQSGDRDPVQADRRISIFPRRRRRHRSPTSWSSACSRTKACSSS